jgi:L-seryl-tRNA(Ser) seleniumtransferase
MDDKKSLLRHIPAVDRLLNEPALSRLSASCPRILLLESVQETVADLRRKILEAPQGTPDLSPAAVAGEAARRAERKLSPSLQPVINATGTLLHTNLGRAPLSDSALEAMQSVARGYSNLEFDLDSGGRGHRYAHVEALLCRLTGAEAATVVNNNAGAVLLALTALARGKEAIVSRGELVEIGGAFRVPDVMAAGGVTLREVGTTNKTHMKDYREAIGAETALFLKVHTSNYRIVGFTASVSAPDLVALARERALMVMEDLGSGMLIDLSPYGLPREPTVREAVEAGIDIVTFSGDKLLGGPQAGVIVGLREAVEKIRRHPMARAMRIDKLTLAAMEATLRHYLDPQEALREIPVLRMLASSPEEIRRRCMRLNRKLSELLAAEASVEVIAEPSQVGGGALPLTELPGFALAVAPKTISAQALADRLRHGCPPVVGRIQEERLLLNPRTLAPKEEGPLLKALSAAFSQP